jgi:hypothetical protein
MKLDISQFISYTRNAKIVRNNLKNDIYLLATSDIASILRTITLNKDNFNVYDIWKYLGRLFIYAIAQDKHNGYSQTETLSRMSDMLECELPIHSAYEPKSLLEQNILTNISRRIFDSKEFYEICAELHISISDLRDFSTAILAVNKIKNNNTSYKDELLDALLKTTQGYQEKDSTYGRLNTQSMEKNIIEEIKNNSIEKDYENYKLF